MPMVSRLQTKKSNIAGVMRVTPEWNLGTWPGDNPNQCAQQFSCPPPTVNFDNFAPVQNLYFDIGCGGPDDFTFKAAVNASWLTVSPNHGSISCATSPELRVFASVSDWSKLQAGANTATITFTATSASQPPLTLPATFVAQKNTLPTNFKGLLYLSSSGYKVSDHF